MNPDSNMMQPVLEPGWTLNYEMFFYAVFALTLFLKQSLRFPAIAILFVGIAMIGAAFDGSATSEFYARAIILEFVFGMAIAQFGIRLPVIAVPLGIGIMIAFQSSPADRLFTLGIPASLIIAGALSFENRLPKWNVADFLGSASYSIYLFHLPALSFIVKFWPIPNPTKIQFAFVAFGFMMLTGCAVYRWIERPLIAMIAGFAAKPKADRVAAAA